MTQRSSAALASKAVRYQVRHATRYGYSEPVELAWQLAHLCPVDRPGQVVLRSRVTATPQPARMSEGLDHFGNRAVWLYLDEPHEDCAVVLDAVVEVDRPPAPSPSDTQPWETVRELAAASREPEVAEFLFASHHVPLDPSAFRYVAESFPAGRTSLEALVHLLARIPKDLAFRPGATTISTPVAQVLAGKAGVCQDFAHLVLAGLRGLGLPARYVSGYLRTRPPPGGTRRRGADASHAWVEVWLGPETGWIGIDPTNDVLVANEHVVLAIGRDFSDVSPLKGVLLGGGAHGLSVAVDLDVID